MFPQPVQMVPGIMPSEPLDGAQSFRAVGGPWRNGASGGIKDRPTGSVDRIRLRFNIDALRPVHAFDGLADNRHGRGQIIRQSRGCEMVIVQRDGCRKPQMCHAVIIGKSG
jgi:hypothetical protein